MKIIDILKEHIPYDVCGNKDISQFSFKVINNASYVKCWECEESYPRLDIDRILQRVRENRIKKIENMR